MVCYLLNIDEKLLYTCTKVSRGMSVSLCSERNQHIDVGTEQTTNNKSIYRTRIECWQ